MPLTDAGWAAAAIDIVDRLAAGTITKVQAETELAEATNDWPTRTLSSADLANRIVALLAVAADVKGPGANTANHVPQWDGANSKVLKDGRAIGAAASTDLLDRAAGDARYAGLAGAAFTGNVGVVGDLSTEWNTGTNRFIGSRFLDGANYEVGMRLLADSRETRILSKAADGGGLISFYTGAGPTERARITAGGNVGIGTTAPGAPLTVRGAGDANGGVIAIQGTGLAGGLALYEDSVIRGALGYGDGGGILSGAATDSLSLRAEGKLHLAGDGNQLAVTVTNGNVGIGTTSPSAKLHLHEDATNKPRLRIDRGSGGSSGNSGVEFYSGAAFIGGFFLDSGDNFNIFTASGQAKLTISSAGQITPGTDNAQNFGSGSLRWDTGYFAGGVITTSDERQKILREGGNLTEAEYLAWSDVRAIVYRSKDSFDSIGDAARLHVGYSWQGIKAAFEAQGLDPAAYGLWCEDPVLAPVEKTRTATRSVEGQTETITLDEFETVQETETVDQPFEEVQIIDGAPVLVRGVRPVEQPVFDSVQVKDEGGVLLFVSVQAADPGTGEPLFDDPDHEDGEPVPRMVDVPLMASVPRMVTRAKTQTVPVMEEYEETYTEMEPTGETIGALRYQECAVLEAAWLRRELASVAARVAALEPA